MLSTPDTASVISSSARTSSSGDLGPFPSIRCNLSSGVYADNLYTCEKSPKNLKNLNFVVCSERTIEIHESETAYRKRKRARCILDLSTMFGVTKRTNDKVDLCLVLVSPEQTFFLRALNETATHEWYGLLISNIHTTRSMVQNRQISYNDFPEAVWDVKITQRPRIYRKQINAQIQNLCTKEKLAWGRKRLCFYPHAVILLQMHTEPGDLATNLDRDPDQQDPNNYFYFPRAFISFYGCVHKKYFFIKTSTSVFGTCEVVMKCEDASTAIEIFKKFESMAIKNVSDHQTPWTSITENEQDDEDVGSSESREEASSSSISFSNKSEPRNSTGRLSIPTAHSYIQQSDTPTRRPPKEVHFKGGEKEEDRVEIEKLPKESLTVDSLIDAKIAVDVLRLGGKKSMAPPKEMSANKFSGFIASLRRKFNDNKQSSLLSSSSPRNSISELPSTSSMSSSTSQMQEVVELKELKQWAENRASLIEDETEDSGGTLKVEDPSQSQDPVPEIPVEQQRRIRRDALFSEAVKDYQRQVHKEAVENGTFESIEMKDLSRLANDMIASASAESSMCCSRRIVTDSDSELEPEQPLPEILADSASSTSALDSCLSNTSENLSASSSLSNSEYAEDRVILKVKKPNEIHPREGYTDVPRQAPQDDGNSDMSVDSCYSSLTNNGYHRLLARSHSLSLVLYEITDDTSLRSKQSLSVGKIPVKFDIQRLKIERTPTRPSVLKPTKSSEDLLSDAQYQDTFRSEPTPQLTPERQPEDRQRATSLGDKQPVGIDGALSEKSPNGARRHRHACKKKGTRSSQASSQTSGEQVSLVSVGVAESTRTKASDPRHSSVSSRSEHSSSRNHPSTHRNATPAQRPTRISHSALLRKNPHRANTEDLAEVVFVENSPVGGNSISSGDTPSTDPIHSRSGSDSQRETVRAFGNTNRALIPTTRYSDTTCSSSATRNSKSNSTSKQRTHRKGFELESVQCFINFGDNNPAPSVSRKNNRSDLVMAETSSSRDSVDEHPSKCRKAPKRHRNDHQSGASSHDSGREHKHSCRRRRTRTSYQEAIAEEVVENSQQPQSVVDPPSQQQQEVESPLKNSNNSGVSPQRSSDETIPQQPHITLDLINNNPNPLPISV